jgi:thiol-disulfide isomerase/thioredoxin
MKTCPYCILLKPTWDQVKQNVECYEVEYSDMHKLPAELQKVRGFPTIQVIDGKKVKSEYVGERSFEGIMNFAKSNGVKMVTSTPAKKSNVTTSKSSKSKSTQAKKKKL